MTVVFMKWTKTILFYRFSLLSLVVIIWPSHSLFSGLYVPALLYACVLILVLSNPKSIIGGPLSPKSQVYIVLCVEPLKINN